VARDKFAAEGADSDRYAEGPIARPCTHV